MMSKEKKNIKVRNIKAKFLGRQLEREVPGFEGCQPASFKEHLNLDNFLMNTLRSARLTNPN